MRHADQEDEEERQLKQQQQQGSSAGALEWPQAAHFGTAAAAAEQGLGGTSRGGPAAAEVARSDFSTGAGNRCNQMGDTGAAMSDILVTTNDLQAAAWDLDHVAFPEMWDSYDTVGTGEAGGSGGPQPHLNFLATMTSLGE
jgi:hypothetical protein